MTEKKTALDRLNTLVDKMWECVAIGASIKLFMYFLKKFN